MQQMETNYNKRESSLGVLPCSITTGVEWEKKKHESSLSTLNQSLDCLLQSSKLLTTSPIVLFL